MTNKKILYGLMALLFVTSIAQTSAIMKLMREPESVSYATSTTAINPVDLMASTSMSTVISDEPEDGGFWILIYFFDDGDGGCGAWGIDNDLTSDTYGEQQYWSGTPDGNGGCENMSVPGPNVGTINVIRNKDGVLSLSGSNEAIDAQIKLFALGRLGLGGLSGRMDTVTQNALKIFQSENNLPATGVYGPKTKAALMSASMLSSGPSIVGQKFGVSK